MLSYLKSKIVIAFAIFGAALALVLGLLSRVGVAWLSVRILAGALLMGCLGFGLDFFLRQSLSPEDYEELFRKKSPDESSPETAAPGLDVVDEPGLAPDQEYSALYKDTGNPDHAETTRADVSDGSGGQDEPTAAANPAPAFQPDDSASIPRVTRNVPPDIGAPDRSDEDKSGRPFAERTVSGTGDTSVKFKMGAKSVTADPKVIAKAIRTVLQREK